MTISVVQSTALSGGSGSFGASVTAGNTVVLIPVAYDFGNVTITSSSPTLGGSSVTGTAKLADVSAPYSGSGVVYTGAWMLPHCPGGSASVAVTIGGGGTALNIFAYEISGLGSSPVLDKSSTGSAANSANPSSGASGAVTSAPEIIFGAAAELSVALTSPGSPWTVLAGNSNYTWAGYQVVTSSGGSYTWSQSSGGGANSWGALVAAVKGTAAAAGTAPRPIAPVPGWPVIRSAWY